jgi:hypothetical protein
MAATLAPAAPAAAATTQICPGQSYGPGWFWVHTFGGACPGGLYHLLESWYDRPIGDVMYICAGQPIPAEWQEFPAGYMGSCDDSNPPQTTWGVKRISAGVPQINSGGIVDPATNSPFNIHANSVVAMYGLDFYPPDTVYIDAGGVEYTSPRLTYDGLFQINFQLPAGVTGAATVSVRNMAGNRGAPSPINILP